MTKEVPVKGAAADFSNTLQFLVGVVTPGSISSGVSRAAVDGVQQSGGLLEKSIGRRYPFYHAAILDCPQMYRGCLCPCFSKCDGRAYSASPGTNRRVEGGEHSSARGMQTVRAWYR